MVGKLIQKEALRKRGLFSLRKRRSRRVGSSTIDYFLLIAIVLPLAAFLFRIAPRAMHFVYDLLTVVVAWPFL
jgi:hypothetical protein